IAIPYHDGWLLGGNKTLYIKTIDDMSVAALEDLAIEYAKAYQNIGTTITLALPIQPEKQAGDAVVSSEAGTNDYIKSGVVKEVRNIIRSDSARTLVTLESGGTIVEDGGDVTTYTAFNVTGDTRRMELIDVILKAARQKETSSASISGIDGGEI